MFIAFKELSNYSYKLNTNKTSKVNKIKITSLLNVTGNIWMK